jgi:hypothetical protein
VRKTPPKKSLRKGSRVKAAPAAPRPSTPRSAPVGRLGDDVAPRLSREPVSIIVAKTDVVAGGVRIRASSPSVLRVAKGQVVHVKHAYRLQEHSPEREEYRFLLKSRLGGREHAPSLARLGDQWGIPEDISGYLQHEYALGQPGTHTLEFEVGSEYCVMGWGDTAVQALERKELKGAIDVIVG